MEDYESIPNIEWGKDCSYDTLHSIITGWCARIWLTDRLILTALWKGAGASNQTHLMVWSEVDQDYSRPMTIPTDKITKIEIL